MARNGITAEQTIKAIQGSKGFITVIAKRLGCSARHVYNLLNKYTTAADALYHEREGMKDFAEGKLYQLIEDKNPTAIIFYLKTQAKDRGYVERQEQIVAQQTTFSGDDFAAAVRELDNWTPASPQGEDA